MNNDLSLEAIVQKIVTEAISTYLDKKKEPTSQHVILDRVFPTERRIRSIMGGLETSLGTTVWEKLALAIASSNDFEVLNKKDFLKPINMPPTINALIARWRQDREVPGANFGLEPFILELRKIIATEIDISKINFTKVSSGDGIDLWLEKDNTEYIFDIKTVQINAGNGNAFAGKIMTWYAYRFLSNPSADIKIAMVFPYSPYKPFTVDSWWANQGGRAYPLKREDDALVQDDFWNLLTGQNNTWQRILKAFDKLGESGFAEKYYPLFYGSEDASG